MRRLPWHMTIPFAASPSCRVGTANMDEKDLVVVSKAKEARRTDTEREAKYAIAIKEIFFE